mmetsp:Transcript_27277/g.69370  ORF Transcript_27277/g.69370 Transcript_27277/m.69370 type:complete len:83 (+) Transcript_27277:1181-1429(+)
MERIWMRVGSLHCRAFDCHGNEGDVIIMADDFGIRICPVENSRHVSSATALGPAARGLDRILGEELHRVGSAKRKSSDCALS